MNCKSDMDAAVGVCEGSGFVAAVGVNVTVGISCGEDAVSVLIGLGTNAVAVTLGTGGAQHVSSSELTLKSKNILVFISTS